jgi:glucan phosphorylase
MAWLEEPNMKYIMEFGAVGKLQLIRNITNLLHDEEWAIRSWSQFAAAFDVEQREWVMDQAQPDILADSEGDF